MNRFVFQKVRVRVRFNGAEAECNVFTFGKNMCLCKKYFLLPVLKNSQNTDVKAPTSHIFNTTMDSLLEGCGDVSEDRVTLVWQFHDPLRADGLSCSFLDHSPSTRQIFLGETCYPPCPKELSEGSLCSVGLWDLSCAGTELTGTTGTLPSTKSWAGTSPVPFSDISIEKGPSYRGFLPISVRVFLLRAEGKCSLPQSSCIFDPTNSLHKQEST